MVGPLVRRSTQPRDKQRTTSDLDSALLLRRLSVCLLLLLAWRLARWCWRPTWRSGRPRTLDGGDLL